MRILSFFLFLLILKTANAATYEYDNRDRLTKAYYENGLIITYQYDKQGNILQVVATDDGPVPTYKFDIDGDGTVLPLTDGLLVLRYQFGFRGDGLVSNALSSSASRNNANDIETYLTKGQNHFDLDGDGAIQPLTDGLLLLRYLFGFRGDGLIANAIGNKAVRTTSDELDTYLLDYLH